MGHGGIGSTASAVFVSKPVRAPATKVVTVRPLAAGTYDLQLVGAPLNVIATLSTSVIAPRQRYFTWSVIATSLLTGPADRDPISVR